MIFDIINNDPGFMSSQFMEDLPGAGTYPFMSGDSKKDFIDSLKVKPKDWYYRNNPIKYTVNSHKFRTKEFEDIDWKNSIVMLGCSHTFGVGVTDEHTIAAYLEKFTGKYVVNLGSPGLSNGAIAYNTYYLKEKYPTPIAVVNLWTNMPRWFRIGKGKKLENVALRAYYPDDNKQVQLDDVDKILNTELVNNVIYMKMSNALWKDHPNHIQTCFYDYVIDDSTTNSLFSNLLGYFRVNVNSNDPKLISIARKVFPEIIQLKRSWIDDKSARDNDHWGRETHEKIAKMIASNIKL